tara:strand:- start:2991 stop:4040 length:1050 start_codon:yes stop_codon:yes gene_type:complete
MLYNKRGTWKTIRKWILLILIAIILIPLTVILMNEGTRGAEIAACKNWVILQSSTKLPGVGIPIKELNNPCTTFQDETKGKKYEDFKTTAKGMHDVWNMYGKGEIDFLTDIDLAGAYKSNVYCFIGDEITFDEYTEIDIDEFEEYLVSNYPPESKITYSEVFMKAEKAEIDFGSGTLEMEEGENLYLIYAVEKKAPEEFLDIAESIGKGALFTAFGTTNFKSLAKGTKALSTRKAFTGTLTQPRAPKGGISIGNKLYKGGQFIPKSAAAKVGTGVLGKAGVAGLIIGVAGTALYVSSDQSVMIPSLLVTKGENIIKEGCEVGIHYNPKKNVLKDFIGGDLEEGLNFENA